MDQEDTDGNAGIESEWPLHLTNPPFDPNNTAMSSGNFMLDELKFNGDGLVPLIVQDARDGQVLMLAYMNRTALEKTIETGKVHTYSRSRGRLALKGERSGHFQHMREILTDCDKDVVLIKVEQDVAACHEGYRSCFFNRYEAGATRWKKIAEKVFEPEKVYVK